MANSKKRCFGDSSDLYSKYHDEEWGVPVHDDSLLFEMLTLEGAQAGLSWETILKRRKAYQKAFHQFDPQKVAQMKDSELEELYQNGEIIRNKLKIYSVRKNALAFLKIQKEYGSFDSYLWGFVQNKPIMNTWKSSCEVPVKSLESENLSKDLKKRGFSFVGPLIIYAFMQAVGLVNDHLTICWKFRKK